MGGVCRLALSVLTPTILLVSCGESEGGPSRSGSEAVEAPSAESWQTIEHRGVQVDIPASWSIWTPALANSRALAGVTLPFPRASSNTGSRSMALLSSTQLTVRVSPGAPEAGM